MQESIISPALFTIFIEPMLKILNREFNIEDIFAYADDKWYFFGGIFRFKFVLGELLGVGALTPRHSPLFKN